MSSTNDRPTGRPRTIDPDAVSLVALRLFDDQGFDAVSMDDVAAAAGVTKLIVYRHFESKEALYRSVLERVFERQVTLFMENLASGLEAGGATPPATIARRCCW